MDSREESLSFARLSRISLRIFNIRKIIPFFHRDVRSRGSLISAKIIPFFSLAISYIHAECFIPFAKVLHLFSQNHCDINIK